MFVVAIALWGLNTLSQNSSSSLESTRKPGEKVYAAIEGEGAIAVIDGESNKVVTKIDLTDSKSGRKYSPHNVQVSPDGNAVWVTANAEMKTHNHSLRIIKPAYASAEHQDKYKDTGTTIGIDDNFIREIGNTIELGTSALFVLVRKSTPDKVLEDLSKFEGKVLRTSLSKEDEAKLQAALTKGETDLNFSSISSSIQ
jgi:DNA-binding beta-propeller fold protein YncE